MLLLLLVQQYNEILGSNQMQVIPIPNSDRSSLNPDPVFIRNNQTILFSDLTLILCYSMVFHPAAVYACV